MLPVTRLQAGQLQPPSSTSSGVITRSTCASLRACVTLRCPLSAHVDPSFDCPSNLKEAIDWILRVAGKDGGSGDNGAITVLSQQVKKLLEEVKDSDPAFSQEFGKVKQALTPGGSGNGLIGKLAEGLQQFIGYDPQGRSVRIQNGQQSITVGKITGGGILPANVAKHQVCNAVLNFVIRFLEGLCGFNVSNGSDHKQKVLAVIATLRNCVGTGQVPRGFKELVEKIEGKVQTDLNGLQDNVNKNLKDVFEKLKTVVTSANLDNGGSESVQSSNIDNFLDEVFGKVKGENPGGSFSRFTHLCAQLSKLFNENIIKSGLSTSSPLQDSALSGKIKAASNAATINALTLEIDNLRTKTKRPNAAVFTAVRDAATAFIADLQTKAYTSFYNGVDDEDVGNDQCAKIFLGCLPLYYQALTYIYWKCHEKGGGWNAMTLGGGPLKDFLYSMWYDPSKLHVLKRGQIVVSSLDDKFKDFQQKMQAASNKSYPQFLKELHDNAKQKLATSPTECPLSALYYCASCYFTCKQATITTPTKSPSTIREMLFFLAALPFSPMYEGLVGHIDTVLPNELDVADSALNTPSNKLSADNIKDYIISSLLLPPSLLGVIQDNSASDDSKSDPWLHRLYCNTHFNLKFPSSPSALFNALSNYAYALQFQLGFLYQQCSQLYVNTCGWFMCTFGQGVNTTLKTQVVQHHICPAGCSNHNIDDFSDHMNGDCGHKDCGENTNASPLQAFLTDKLKGFSRGHPASLSNHLVECSGSICHVPMGFKAKCLRPGSKHQGGHITIALTPFCGSYTAPLPQLSEKLGCLTKRTPRSLGDIFGFIWTLNSQLFKGGVPAEESLKEFFKSIGLSSSTSSIDLQIAPSTFYNMICEKLATIKEPSASKAIERALSLFPGLPFWYYIFMVKPDDSLPAVLFKIKNIPHQTEKEPTYSGHHNDLYSLYNQMCNESPNNTCGKYLYPLCYGNGATYTPKSATNYLSWVLYLSDDLQSWFQDMLDEFKDIDCTKSGCAGQSKC
ncbi:variant erythrocyte surface antigen-1 family protein [Babesia caballi]|uniref:Variant erythrocyte surface antigen-1 family protein n=1 Tax=Babesia caballi TaxID=5871 RepID=A0AAV4M1F8_BABCB|nr:variant erythrocyte surface antigen-1 family protein [Babesia caballi]